MSTKKTKAKEKSREYLRDFFLLIFILLCSVSQHTTHWTRKSFFMKMKSERISTQENKTVYKKFKTPRTHLSTASTAGWVKLNFPGKIQQGQSESDESTEEEERWIRAEHWNYIELSERLRR